MMFAPRPFTLKNLFASGIFKYSLLPKNYFGQDKAQLVLANTTGD
jgi:hypothetical protein